MCERIKAIVWHILMLVWLAGLVFGLWWIWPNFERPALSSELLGSVLWLLGGIVCWLFALRFGLQRYWRR